MLPLSRSYPAAFLLHGGVVVLVEVAVEVGTSHKADILTSTSLASQPATEPKSASEAALRFMETGNF